MIRTLPLAFILLGSGCGLLGAGGGIEEPPEPKVDEPEMPPQLLGLQNQIDQLKYTDQMLMDQLTKIRKDQRTQLKDLTDRMDRVEKATSHLITAFEDYRKGKSKRVEAPEDGSKKTPVDPETVSGQSGEKGKEPKEANPAPVLNKAELLAESIQRMKQSLPPVARDDIAGKLSAFSTDALKKLMDELRTPRANLHFVRNFTAVVSTFPTEVLLGPFEDALKEPGIRGFIAETIGRTGSRSLGGLLRNYTGTNDPDFRSHVAEALALCGHVEGVRMLVEQLRSKDPSLRTIALLTLKRLSGGLTFGYRPPASPDQEANKKAIQKWEAWFRENQAKLFED